MLIHSVFYIAYTCMYIVHTSDALIRDFTDIPINQ